MKVVLIKDVKGSGKAGDIIEAKNGYAQNYLIKARLSSSLLLSDIALTTFSAAYFLPLCGFYSL